MLEWGQKCLTGVLIFPCVCVCTENRFTDGAGGQSGSELLEHAVGGSWGLSFKQDLDAFYLIYSRSTLGFFV